MYLVDVIDFEVFEQQQQDGRDGLDDDLFVTVHVDAQLHALQHRGPAEADVTMTWSIQVVFRCECNSES